MKALNDRIKQEAIDLVMEMVKSRPDLTLDEITTIGGAFASAQVMTILGGEVKSIEEALKEEGIDERRELFNYLIPQICKAICPDWECIIIGAEPIGGTKFEVHMGYSMTNEHCKGILGTVISGIEREEEFQAALPEFYKSWKAKHENN